MNLRKLIELLWEATDGYTKSGEIALEDYVIYRPEQDIEDRHFSWYLNSLCDNDRLYVLSGIAEVIIARMVGINEAWVSECTNVSYRDLFDYYRSHGMSELIYYDIHGFLLFQKGIVVEDREDYRRSTPRKKGKKPFPSCKIIIRVNVDPEEEFKEL